MTLYETGLIRYAMTQYYRSQLHFSLCFPARLLWDDSVWPYIRSDRLAHEAALLQWSLLFYRLFLLLLVSFSISCSFSSSSFTRLPYYDTYNMVHSTKRLKLENTCYFTVVLQLVNDFLATL